MPHRVSSVLKVSHLHDGLLLAETTSHISDWKRPWDFTLQGVSPATRSLWLTTTERPSWRFLLSAHIRKPKHLGTSSTHRKMSMKAFVAPSRHHTSSRSVSPFVTKATPDNRSPRGLRLSRVSSKSTLAPKTRNTAHVLLPVNLPTLGKPLVGSSTDDTSASLSGLGVASLSRGNSPYELPRPVQSSTI